MYYLKGFVSFSSDSSLSKLSPCSEAGKPCNPCLDAAKACNLNETCKRLRFAYNSICSKATPPQPSLAYQEPCSRKRCQKVSARSSFFGDRYLPVCIHFMQGFDSLHLSRSFSKLVLRFEFSIQFSVQ